MIIGIAPDGTVLTRREFVDRVVQERGGDVDVVENALKGAEATATAKDARQLRS